MSIAFYISGHGFGHATRDIELINALGRRRPDLEVAVRTAAPKWLFDLTLTRPVAWAPLECDTGVVQLDSLRLDAHETMRRACRFHETIEARAAEEAAWLRARGVRLVLGDIPPLAFAAARAAGLRSVAIGNFTWDWIYEAYRDETPDGCALIERIRNAYASADLALRLPMHGGFDACPRVIDLPFIARKSARDRDEVRAALRLPAGRPLVLLSFGGYGLARIDLEAAAAASDYTFVLTADVTASRRSDSVPETELEQPLPANVVLVDERALYAGGWRYEDLVAAVDVVMTKPGYGIIAECAANGTAMVYTSRGHFVEYDVLVREMPRWLRCAFISNDDLLAGRWRAALDDVLRQPEPPERADVTGAERAVDLILEEMAT
ncbi:MAG TPA: hypothetical protein VF198_09990 [Vicinamibacterales bacterium]